MPGDAGRNPEAIKIDQSRCQITSGSGNIVFFWFDSFAQRRRSDFSSNFADFSVYRKIRKPRFVPRMAAKTEVRPFAQRVDAGRGKTLKIDPKMGSKSHGNSEFSGFSEIFGPGSPAVPENPDRNLRVFRIFRNFRARPFGRGPPRQIPRHARPRETPPGVGPLLGTPDHY